MCQGMGEAGRLPPGEGWPWEPSPVLPYPSLLGCTWAAASLYASLKTHTCKTLPRELGLSSISAVGVKTFLRLLLQLSGSKFTTFDFVRFEVVLLTSSIRSAVCVYKYNILFHISV